MYCDRPFETRCCLVAFCSARIRLRKLWARPQGLFRECGWKSEAYSRSVQSDRWVWRFFGCKYYQTVLMKTKTISRSQLTNLRKKTKVHIFWYLAAIGNGKPPPPPQFVSYILDLTEDQIKKAGPEGPVVTYDQVLFRLLVSFSVSSCFPIGY